MLRLIDLALYLGTLEGIEGDRGAAQAPVGPASHRHHDLQIAPQLGDHRRGWIRLVPPLHFQK
ncbi:MAG TPA: hypothetical protein VHM88_20425 [Candidatus Acidoferrales bacterium]|nr:hypothetical protein [Candidatus Acidoferrales bacterium]